jgi:hypothetical protein
MAQSYTLDLTPEQAGALLKRFGSRLAEALRSGAMAAVMDAARHAAREHLSGQDLRVRSGNLRRSVLASPYARVEGAAVVAGFGTNLGYGRAHERGFRGRVEVRAHGRGASRVRAHGRNMNVVAKRYLRRSLNERRVVAQRLVDAAVALLVRNDRPPTPGEVAGAV